MWNAATWREKAVQFRERAAATRDAERERIFLHLAEDCEEMAVRLESKQTVEGTARLQD